MAPWLADVDQLENADFGWGVCAKWMRSGGRVFYELDAVDEARSHEDVFGRRSCILCVSITGA
jgi:hypothetical protein